MTVPAAPSGRRLAPRSRRLIRCQTCGLTKPHAAKNRCGACYYRLHRRHQEFLESQPPGGRRAGPRAAPLSDYVALRVQGFSQKQAASRLFVSRCTAWRYEREMKGAESCR